MPAHRLIYFAFGPTLRLGRWFERRFTAAGRLFAGTFVVAALFSIDPGQSLALAVAGFTGTALALAWLGTLRFRPAVSVRRALPDRLSDGTTAHYAVTLANAGRRVQRGLYFSEVIDAPLPTLAEFAAFRSDSDPLRPRFDRIIGFPRWVEMVRLRRGAICPPLRLPPLPAGASVTATAAVTPLRRGRLAFTGCELVAPDPLGLCLARSRLALPDSVLVLPQRIDVPAIELRAHRQYQRGGVTLARSVGDANEFVGLRDYRPGDSLRNVHWRSWARLGHPVVREFQDEYFDRHLVVLDSDVPHGSGRCFETMVAAAASLVARPQPADALLDLLVDMDGPLLLTAGRGTAAALPLLDALACAAPAPGSGARLARFLEQTIARIGSVIIVCGRPERPATELATIARRHGAGCCLLWVRAAQETGPGHGLPPGCRLEILDPERCAGSTPTDLTETTEGIYA